MGTLPPTDERRTVFVIHPGALGDVLLALPALRNIRRQWPGRAMGLLAGKEMASLLLQSGEVERVFSMSENLLALLYSSPASVPQPMVDWLARCDLAVAWLSSGQEELQASLRTMGVGTVLIGSPHEMGLKSRHQQDRFGEAVGLVDPHLLPPDPLILPESLHQEGHRVLESVGLDPGDCLVAVHPGSGSRHKCLSPSRLAEFVGAIRLQGCRPFLIGGPADHQALHDLVTEMPSEVPVLRDLPIWTLAGVICHASLFVGHDSGLTHLAALLLCPTVAAFGPTDPSRWAPRGPLVSIVRGPECLCEDWATVTGCQSKPCLSLSVSELLVACMNAIERSER